MDITNKIKAMTLLAKHLKTLVRNLSVNSWVGVANGDHILIVNANLYRVDLNTEKVSKV